MCFLFCLSQAKSDKCQFLSYAELWLVTYALRLLSLSSHLQMIQILLISTAGLWEAFQELTGTQPSIMFRLL